jgi:hypothetical protein
MSFAQVMGPLAAGAAYAIAPAVPFSVSAALVAGAMVVASVGLRVRPAPSELAPDTLSWPTGVSDPPDVGEVARIDRPASATGAER